MNRLTLVKRSLRFYWRTHLGVLLGAAVSTTVLVGALAIGDSVRYSLRRFALARLGGVHLAMESGDRFFRAPTGEGERGLADEIGEGLGAPAAAVLHLAGSAASAGGEARINQLQVLGVNERFLELYGRAEDGAPSGLEGLDGPPAPGEADLNQRAADQLGVGPGDQVRLSIEKPSAMPRDAALGSEEDASASPWVTVRRVLPDDGVGRFSLRANQVPPHNAFVRLGWLQEQVGQAGKANVLLLGGAAEGGPSAGEAVEALEPNFRPPDAGLQMRRVPGREAVEVRTDRVFLSQAAVEAAAGARKNAIGVLTYFVNGLRVGEEAQHYSMVTGLGPLDADPGAGAASMGLPPDLADDEAIINDWLAEDLNAEPGDTLHITYYVMAPGNRLKTASAAFRIRSVVEISDPLFDRTLMPDFPGISGQEHCREWRSDLVDLSKVRATKDPDDPESDKDQRYWEEYRGTPKALITLEAAQDLWKNRFGDLTAVRYPGATDADALAEAIESHLDPASLGFVFRPVREQALRASTEAMSFGPLFLGLSMFLLFAALVLMGLLFVFGVEQRSEEVGTLLAVGLVPRRVRRLLLAEGGALALGGAAIGLVGGLAYTVGMLRALETVWSGAVGGMTLYFHAGAGTVALGFVLGVVAAVGAVWVTLLRQARRPARELLTGAGEMGAGADAGDRLRGRIALVVGGVATVAAVAIVVLVGLGSPKAATGAFFGAGALLLVAGLAFSLAVVGRLDRLGERAVVSLPGLGVRNAARRRGRSLATIALLACGTFMIVAVGANRRDPLAGAGDRTSGTGGFALYGETALPVHRDLNDPAVRRERRLAFEEGREVRVVPIRVRPGDEASCLNLNRPQQPRLAGVPVGGLDSRFAFASVIAPDAARFKDRSPLDPDESPWTLLGRETADGAVPAVADTATIVWSLGKKIGDTVTYTDSRGRTFEVRFVAALAPSMLQGSVFIAEEAFLAKYPSASGYRMFLIDGPTEEEALRSVSRELTRSLRREGLDLVPATERLAAFYGLENTYLAIFQLLGGLGMLLGSIGLGLVVLRNVLERRGELALMRAVGYGRGELRRLVLWEHWGLLALGLVCGVVAAIVAVLPALGASGYDVPYVSLGMTLVAILASGSLWTYLASAAALRGPLLEALRNE
jgi:ABC-type lipoprotein release transport system permease subunit